MTTKRQVLSVIIPVFNEVQTLRLIVDKVREVKLPGDMEMELILVDDGSTDGTRNIYKDLRPLVSKIILHRKNMGKGAAIRTGISQATGDFVAIQDADLEYDPNEFPKLLQPLIDDRADVVYGSRFLGGEQRRVLYFWHMVANRVLTLASNMFSNLNLTDMETCYKIFRRSALEGVRIEENRFGFEPEITAKLARKGVRFYEIGISYHGRTYDEGKKIGWKDGVSAIRCIIKYSGSPSKDIGRQTLERLETHGDYAKWIFSHFRPHLGSHVLEFGSGLGSLAGFAKDCEKVYITEYNAGYMPELQRKFHNLPNVEIHQMDITNPLPELLEKRIDTVFSSNVVEHIEDDLAALKGAYRLLDPGGKLVILVPAFMQLYSGLDKNLEHYRRYTKASLSRRLRDAGFVVEDAFYMNMFGAIGWWGAGKILRQTEITNFNVWLHSVISPFSRALDRLFDDRPPFGLSVIAIARKPE